MATLVLTAVGGAIGGPVGGAIGAILGQQIDGRLFAPKGRQGPRLGDLAVQTSSYGSELPKIFGMMRVAGTVIWATDLQEHKRTSGGTKGRPKTTDYSYTASFAVALSARPIKGVRRIWAEGKLLRGVGGDFKSATGYRLHLGGEDQEVDGLIAAVEGAAQAPAYRGLAYAVFEDMQLEDFGNRIPSLTFEVEADSELVSVGAMAGELSGGAIEDGGTPGLSGFAAGGDSVRAVLETLAQAMPLSVRDNGNALSLVSAYDAPILVDAGSVGATSANGAGGAGDVSQRGMGGLVGEVSVAYHDPARDFQAGLQRATRGTTGQPHERLALPATLSAGAAKAIAEQRLSALWAGRSTATQHLSWNWMAARPGACVRLPDQRGRWKIERWMLDRMVVSVDLVRVGEGTAPDPPAASGRPIGHADLFHGPTSVYLIDLPPVGDSLMERPQLAVGAAGGEGWRRASLSIRFDSSEWQDIGSTAPAAVMGVAMTMLAEGGAALVDASATVEIELLNDEMWLESRSDDALVGGANAAMLGGELIQFGVAEPLGDRRFRLSRLLRGRRGTEWAATTHTVGEPFVLLDPAALRIVEASLTAVGRQCQAQAIGIGDDEPATASLLIGGEAIRPPTPVHLRAEWVAGDLLLNWVRRSRSGWTWSDGIEAPLAEEAEIYRLIMSDGAQERTFILSEPRFTYTSNQRMADGIAAPFSLEVAQLGTWAESRPATAFIAG